MFRNYTVIAKKKKIIKNIKNSKKYNVNSIIYFKFEKKNVKKKKL